MFTQQKRIVMRFDVRVDFVDRLGDGIILLLLLRDVLFFRRDLFFKSFDAL